MLHARAIATQGLGYDQRLVAVHGLWPVELLVEPAPQKRGRLHRIVDAVAYARGSEALAWTGLVRPERLVIVDASPFIASGEAATGRCGLVRVRFEWNANPIVRAHGVHAIGGYVFPADSISSEARVCGARAVCYSSSVAPSVSVDARVHGHAVFVADPSVRALGIKNLTDEELLMLIEAALEDE